MKKNDHRQKSRLFWTKTKHKVYLCVFISNARLLIILNGLTINRDTNFQSVLYCNDFPLLKTYVNSG